MISDLNFSKLVGFNWDEGNLIHIKKHNVRREECEEVFFNKPLIIGSDETHSQKEERFRAYGRTDKVRLLTIIFTIRANKIRIISARNQNRKERKEFIIRGGENI